MLKACILRCTLVPFAGAVLLASYAHADAAEKSPESSVLQEIIVTAQKRAEKLQEVPASIAVVSGDVLTKANVDSVLELSRAIPGLAVANEFTLFSTISLRGIGTLNNGFSVEPSVGTVIDGVVMARSGSTVLNYNDVERVEVLRGPQGTLFGKNTSAGALNVVTKDPTNDLTGNLRASYGTYHEVKVNGALSGALISNTLLARVSFLTDSHDGFIHNILDGRDLDASHQQAVRGKLLFTPQDGTRILLIADYANLHSSCCVLPVRGITPRSNLAEQGLLPTFAGFAPGFIGPTNSQVDTRLDDAQTDNKSKGVSFQLDQAIGDFTLTSITAYRTWNALDNAAAQANTTPVTIANLALSTVHQHQTSEELRITSPKGEFVDYVAGLFFYKDSLINDEHFILDLAPILGTPPGMVVLPAAWTNTTSSVNYAAFGEANIHVTSAVALIAGARESHEKVDFHLAGFYIGNSPMGADDSDTVNNLSWRLGARWKINSDNMVYATVSRGFKGPAFNGNSTIFGNGQRANPEIATSYELGWKAELLDQRLRTNLAVFLTNLDQFQVQGFIVPPGATIAQQFLINAQQLRSKGVEFELESTPFKNLSVNFNAAYIDAKYRDFPNAPCWSSGAQTAAQGCVNGIQNLAGVVTPNTPKVAFNADANYDIMLPSVPFDAFVRADYAWKDKVQWDPTNDPTGLEGAYGLLGGALGINSKSRRYTVTAYGRNITNKFHTAGIVAGATPLSILLPDYKRTWGIGFEYRF